MTAASEELLEKVAETRATEMELETLSASRSTPGAGLLAGGRPEPGAVFPIRPQFIVTLAFLRVAEYFVGFVDFLELRFRDLLVFGYIRMVLPGEPAESLLDVILACATGHAKCGIVIFEFNGHGGGKSSKFQNP